MVALKVTSARTEPRAFGGTGVTKGAAITHFKYIINVDDTGTTDQRSAAPGSGCSTADQRLPGLLPVAVDRRAVRLGRRSTPRATRTVPDRPSLPQGRYLISVLADGYKIDGAHFCVDTGAPSVPGCRPR